MEDSNIYEKKVPYRYQPYPRTRYRADGATRIVNNETEEKALGKGWGGPEIVVPKPEEIEEEYPGVDIGSDGGVDAPIPVPVQRPKR